MRPLVLLSGGMDSTVCLYATLRETHDVITLGFDYGQAHRRELDRAADIADEAGVPFKTILIPALGTPATSGSPVVPNRNAVFLSLAAWHALQHDRDTIIIGACKTDYDDFPDCRLAFFQAFEATLHTAGYMHLAVYAPLLRFDKAAVWALAEDLNILDLVKERTVSCYVGTECGECGACKARNEGYAKYMEAAA